MKNTTLTILLAGLNAFCFSQADTISNNVFQRDGKLGVGTADPNTWLTVVNEDPAIGLHTNTSMADFRRVFGESTARFQIYGYPDTELIPEYMRSSVMLYTTDDAKNLKISATPRGGCIQFLTDGWASATSERMRIDARGRVGIGTKTPEARLQVTNGDIYISDIERGIIMRSPDEQCWRGVLDNSGTLNFTAIDCPGIVTTVETTRSESSDHIRVYPNPSGGHVLVDLGNHAPGKAFYAVYTTGGEMIGKGSLESTIQSLDFSSYATGCYILTINNKRGERMLSEQVVILE